MHIKNRRIAIGDNGQIIVYGDGSLGAYLNPPYGSKGYRSVPLPRITAEQAQELIDALQQVVDATPKVERIIVEVPTKYADEFKTEAETMWEGKVIA